MSIEASFVKRLGCDFRLEVEFRVDGTCLGILGASGGGKSMTLKCIAGVETPDEGRIVMNGKVLFDSVRGINVRPQQRRIGMLFQKYALFPRMTTIENIGVGAHGPGVARVAELVRQFRLEGLEDRYPDQLSGGQQQRAALARMLAADPEVILLDEPFSALDSHLREKMQLHLLDLLKDRGDAVLVTHSRDEAYRLCDELLVLDRGRVLGRGPTRRLFESPGTVRVARLTGCKNISPIRAVAERRLYALDWDLTLNVAVPVPADCAFVGIRAHDLTPVPEGVDDHSNTVAMSVLECSEDPFEQTVVFRNAEARAPAGRGELWWKSGRRLADSQPDRLRLPPESLLLLRGDGPGADEANRTSPIE